MMKNFSLLTALALLGLSLSIHANEPVTNIAVPAVVDSNGVSVSACFSRSADNEDQIRIYGSNGCSGQVISAKNDDGICDAVVLTMVDDTKTCNVQFEGWSKWTGWGGQFEKKDTQTRTIKIKQVVKFTGQPQQATLLVSGYTISTQAFIYDYTTTTGQAVTLSSTTTSVCTVDAAGKISHVATGECILQADAAGTAVYTAAREFISWNIVPDPDTDADGRYDYADNCPTVANADQADKDNDGIGDVCDSDIDGDGFANNEENCPYIINADPNVYPVDPATGTTATVQACFNNNPDVDGDTVINTSDNCIFIANTDQKDTDGDGIGDACDDDKDGDTVKNATDNCPLIPNTAQTDTDADGVGDACEQTFVKTDGNDANDCATWASACKTIQRGIDAAEAKSLTQVFVKKGIYRPSSTINLKAGINIYGGFAGTETQVLAALPGTNLTIISGDTNANDTVNADGIAEAVDETNGVGNLAVLLQANNQGLLGDNNIIVQGFILNAAFSAGNGGALVVNNSRVELQESQVIANKANNGGGGVATGAAQVSIGGVTLKANKASNDGAAIFAESVNTRVTVLSSVLDANIATNNGGAIAATSSATVIVKNTQLKNNQSTNGSAIYTNNAALTLAQSNVESNQASGSGAGLYSQGAANFLVQQTTFVSNQATSSGGAMLLANTGSSVVENSYIASNTAQSGAGVANSAGNSAIRNTVFYANAASDSGGAVMVSNGSPQLDYLTLYNNTAATNGGGVYRTGGTLNISRSIVTGNTATSGGNAHGTVADGGYNLVGFNGSADVAGGASFATAGSFVPTADQATEVSAIIQTTPTKEGGDGYFSSILNLPIMGGGPARDAIPEASCGAITTDIRGEARPDLKEKKCDIGAYEFLVLSCQEDAQRRFNQGERFVKSCDPNLEQYEVKLGVVSLYGVFILILLTLVRVRYKQK